MMKTDVTGGAVIFDLDGTLVDSLPDLAAALNRLLQEEGQTPVSLEEAGGMVGDGVAQLVRRGFVARQGEIDETRLAGDLVPRFLVHYDRGLVEKTQLFEGALDTLRDLSAAHWQLGLCTNKPEEPSRRIAAALGFLDLVPVIVGGDTLAERKPAAAPLLAAIERLGAEPGRTVMVGDNANDVLAARRAGVAVIAVSFGYSTTPARDLGADRVIDHFRDLPDAVHDLL